MTVITKTSINIKLDFVQNDVFKKLYDIKKIINKISRLRIIMIK